MKLYTSWFINTTQDPVQVSAVAHSDGRHYNCKRAGRNFTFKIPTHRCFETYDAAAADLATRRQEIERKTLPQESPPAIASAAPQQSIDIALALNRLADLAECALAMWEREIERRDF